MKKTRSATGTSGEPGFAEDDRVSEISGSVEIGEQSETSSIGGDNFEAARPEQVLAEAVCAPSAVSGKLDDTIMACDNDEGNRFATSIVQTVRRFYSTTSSVYAEQTITNPNVGHILFWYVGIRLSSAFTQMRFDTDYKEASDNRSLQPSYRPVAFFFFVVPTSAFPSCFKLRYFRICLQQQRNRVCSLVTLSLIS
jgi:hypothetical protein